MFKYQSGDDEATHLCLVGRREAQLLAGGSADRAEPLRGASAGALAAGQPGQHAGDGLHARHQLRTREEAERRR